MIQIDLKKLRDTLPEKASLVLGKKNSVCYIDCFVSPSLSELAFELTKKAQKDIIGSENVNEFYTEEEGRDWRIYLNRVPMEFINLTDEDVNNYSGVKILK